jgi:hypothetical protein
VDLRAGDFTQLRGLVIDKVRADFVCFLEYLRVCTMYG